MKVVYIKSELHVTTSAKIYIHHLSKQDVVIVWGGSKDVGKNETKKGINCIQKFVTTNSHSNFILMDVPHKYDLEQISCVNKEVDKYNRRLQKHMKFFENTEVIKANLDRRGFIKYGQRMNAKGKEWMAKRIAVAIKHTFKVCKKTPINMKWKEDPSKENQGLGEAKNGVGEGRDPIKNQNDSVSVENNNSRREEDETAVKASRRCRKIPVTRRDDFLWTTTSKTQSR